MVRLLTQHMQHMNLLNSPVGYRRTRWYSLLQGSRLLMRYMAIRLRPVTKFISSSFIGTISALLSGC